MSDHFALVNTNHHTSIGYFGAFLLLLIVTIVKNDLTGC